MPTRLNKLAREKAETAQCREAEEHEHGMGSQGKTSRQGRCATSCYRNSSKDERRKDRSRQTIKMEVSIISYEVSVSTSPILFSHTIYAYVMEFIPRYDWLPPMEFF
jgi:hypothetical protein